MRVRAATPADVQDLAHLHVDTWREAYRGIVPQSYLDGMSYAAFEARWRTILGDRAARALVAEHDGSVLGFNVVGPLREPVPGFDGEVRALYVRPEAQGRGVGRALMGGGFRALREAGLQTALLWVLADNAPGRAFYARLGGEVVGEQTFELGGATLREVAYGWRTLPA